MAVPVVVPHFNLPFSFVGGSVPVVEQDTLDDVANCVEAIIRTPYGFRVYDNTPDFGIFDPVFEVQPVDTELIRTTVMSQESRADLVLSERTDFYDNLIERIRVEVS